MGDCNLAETIPLTDLHFHCDLQHLHSHLWKSQGGELCQVQSRALERPRGSTGFKLRSLFHTLLHWRAPTQLKCPLSSKRGAREAVISQRAAETITLMERRISPRMLKSRSVDFYNHSSRSIKIWHASRLNPSDHSCWFTPSAATILLLLLVFVMPWHFLSCALCIFHISVIGVCCFLLFIPLGVFERACLDSCRLLGFVWGASWSSEPPLPDMTAFTAINGP